MPDTPAPSAAPRRETVEKIAVLKHAPPQGFLRKHVFSLDHKVIGKQYLDLALVAVVIGMVLSWLMRFHLAYPSAAVPGLGTVAPNAAPGGVMTPELYLSLMTMHGTIMVFFVLTTAPFAGFGNFVLPIQVGAEDMAFPRFNMMSFWVTFVAFLVLIAAFFVEAGPPISGWTAYAPLSAIGKDAGPGQGTGADAVGGLDRHLLRRPAARLAQLHRHDSRSADPGHDPGAHAVLRVGMVHHVGASASSPSRCCCPPASSSSSTAWREPVSSFLADWSSVTGCSRIRAVPRCCGSTCSGSSGTPRCTSPSFRDSASSPTSFRPLRGSRCWVRRSRSAA